MKQIVYCGHCGKERNWPRSIRVTTDACSICGSWDAIRKRRIHPRTGQAEIQVVKLNNFMHRADMLENTPEERQRQNPVGG
jgi:hypothetical protein